VVERLGVAGLSHDARVTRVVALLALLVGIQLLSASRGLETRLRSLPAALQGLAYAAIALLVYLGAGPTYEFIYFQF